MLPIHRSPCDIIDAGPTGTDPDLSRTKRRPLPPPPQEGHSRDAPVPPLRPTDFLRSQRPNRDLPEPPKSESGLSNTEARDAEFDRLDVNRDGVLSREEYRAGVGVRSHDITPGLSSGGRLTVQQLSSGEVPNSRRDVRHQLRSLHSSIEEYAPSQQANRERRTRRPSPTRRQRSFPH